MWPQRFALRWRRADFEITAACPDRARGLRNSCASVARNSDLRPSRPRANASTARVRSTKAHAACSAQMSAKPHLASRWAAAGARNDTDDTADNIARRRSAAGVLCTERKLLRKRRTESRAPLSRSVSSTTETLPVRNGGGQGLSSPNASDHALAGRCHDAQARVHTS